MLWTIGRRRGLVAGFSVLAALCLSLFITEAPAAANYTDAAIQWTSNRAYSGTDGADPCDSPGGLVTALSCPSTAPAFQYHNWTQGSVQNLGSQNGQEILDALATDGYKQQFAVTVGGYGTYCYSHSLPGSLGWPILGAQAWWILGNTNYELLSAYWSNG